MISQNKMSAESLPPEQSVDPNQLPNPEQMGMKTLAGNLVVVAEQHGAKGAGDYLNDVLADTEGKVPPEERQAALKLMGGEQRRHLREGLITSAENMVDEISGNNHSTLERVRDDSHIAKATAEELVEEHRIQVGRHLRNGEDAKRAGLSHEDLGDLTRRQRHILEGQADTMEGWARGNRSVVEQFADLYYRATQHERALEEAAEQTDPAKEGEPKDISKLIDEAVKEDTAAQLHETVLHARQEGRDPSEAVFKFMLKERPTEMTTAELKALRTFASDYDHLALVSASKIRRGTESIDQLLRSFMRRGIDEYTYARTIDEAQEVYRKQSRDLQRTAERAISIAPQSTHILQTERDDLARLQQYIAQAKARQTASEERTTS